MARVDIQDYGSIIVDAITDFKLSCVGEASAFTSSMFDSHRTVSDL